MITQILWFLNKSITRRLITSCVLTVSLALTDAAQAEYKPRPDQPAPTPYTDSSGPRGGCNRRGGLPLTVLAPVAHVGLTTSLHPTFAWFVPEKRPLPMEFTLYEFDSNNTPKFIQKLELQSSSGIMKLSLPENKSSLAVGKRYLWQVTIICNRNRPSQNLLARAEIEVVEMPGTLKSALSATSDRAAKANLYAEAGLWYDALHEALASATDGKLGKVAATLLADLAKFEPKQSANLTQIASSDRQ